MRRKHSAVKMIAALFLSIIAFIACSSSHYNELQYRDSFPGNVSMFSYLNKKLKIADIKNKYKLIFYLSGTSPDCIQRLTAIHKIIEIYNFQNISYIILWEDKIPVDAVKKYNIDLNINYTFNNKSSISKSKPNGFLLDEDNKVLQVTGYSYIDVIKNIIALENKPNMLGKVNEEIFADAFGNKKGGLDKNKLTLLMFVSSSCKLCRETEEKIAKNLPALQKKLNVITIRPDFDTMQEYDVNYITDYSLVYFNVYDQVYTAKQFPFFAVLDKDKQVLEHFSNIDALLNYLKSSN